MENLIGKFISRKKIQEIKLAKRKTYLGKDVYEIIYEFPNGTQEISEENLKNIVSDGATDESYVRDKMIDPLVEKVMAILLEGEIKVMDVEYLKQKLTGTINFHHENAETALWGKEYYDKTLFDIHSILTKPKKHGKRNNKHTDAKDIGSDPNPGRSDGQKGEGAVRPE
jgi:hypothetical protein